jgi:hydroxymethylpyrimidine pyrophosphatase-like HAD family hydrolase
LGFVQEQESLFGHRICLGVFTCSGNVFRQDDKIVYSNVFDPSEEFLEDLQLYLDNSQWRTKKGNHIERRPGMINFSTVGRNASHNMREAYARWDKINLEREDIVAYINETYPELEVSIGGSISVDIYPWGKNKGQVIETLRLDPLKGSEWYQVLCPEETRSLIEYGILFI